VQGWRTTRLAKTVSIVGLEGFPMIKAGDNVETVINATEITVAKGRE